MLNWRRPFGGRRREGAPETKDSRVGALIAVGSGGRARWTPRDYASLTQAGFGQNPVAYRCVRMITEAAAATPLAVFADGVRSDDHPLAALLARPNPEQSGVEWLEGVYGALQTAGNAYVEASGDGPPEELWSLRPDRMTVWLGGRFEGVRIEADLDAVPALQPEREALWARLEAASFLTDAERRRMAGLGG